MVLLFAGLMIVVGSVLAFSPTGLSKLCCEWDWRSLTNQNPTSGVHRKWISFADTMEIERDRAAKDVITDELAAGRMTLPEATDLFTIILSRQPSMIPAMRCLYPGNSDRECVAQAMIAYTIRRMEVDRAETLWGQLQAECQNIFGSPDSEPARPGVAIVEKPTPRTTNEALPTGSSPPSSRSHS